MLSKEGILFFCTSKSFCNNKRITSNGNYCNASDTKCELGFQHKERFIPRDYYNDDLRREYCKVKFFPKNKVKKLLPKGKQTKRG